MAEAYQGTNHALLSISNPQTSLACPKGDWADSSQIGAVSIGETLDFTRPVNAKQCGSSLRHMRSQVSACVLFACPGLKQAEQVEVITGSLILLVDLLPEQQWNICLADIVTEGDIQAFFFFDQCCARHNNCGSHETVLN